MTDSWITPVDVLAFNNVRRRLRDLEKELEGGTRESRGTAHGRLAEAATRAEDAIFNVLNVAESYDLADFGHDALRLDTASV